MDMSAHSGPRGPIGTRRRHQAAFSLIEVTLAIGVVAFAFMSILGLIPIGMNTFRQAMNTSVCSQISEQVMNDVQETDFIALTSTNSGNTNGGPYLLTSGTSSSGQTTRYFDYRGNELIAGSSTRAPQGALYWVQTRITPNTIVPGSVASYTAQNAGNPALATVTIQIINNPGATTSIQKDTSSSTSPTYLLWDDPNFQAYTYSGLVSQNSDL